MATAPAFNPVTAFSFADCNVVRKFSSNKSSANIKSDNITVGESVDFFASPDSFVVHSLLVCL